MNPEVTAVADDRVDVTANARLTDFWERRNIPRVFSHWKFVMRRSCLNPISIITVAAGIEIPASGLSQRL